MNNAYRQYLTEKNPSFDIETVGLFPGGIIIKTTTIGTFFVNRKDAKVYGDKELTKHVNGEIVANAVLELATVYMGEHPFGHLPTDKYTTDLLAGITPNQPKK